MNPTEVLATLQEITRAIWCAIDDAGIAIDSDRIYSWLRTPGGQSHLNKIFRDLVTTWKTERIGKVLESARVTALDNTPVAVSLTFDELVTQLGIVPHRDVGAENFPCNFGCSGKIYHSFSFGFPTTQSEVVSYMGRVGYRPAMVHELLCWLKGNILFTNRPAPKYALGQASNGKVVSVMRGWEYRPKFLLEPIGKTFESNSEFLGVYVGKTDNVDFQI